jgi:hypothetical protein
VAGSIICESEPTGCAFSSRGQIFSMARPKPD